LDDPSKTGQRGPGMLPRDKGGYVGGAEEPETTSGGMTTPPKVDEDHGKADDRPKRKGGETVAKDKSNPWAKERGGPSENWQPKAWTPGPRRRD
jgi:NADH dehydrogenase [ubiquinone] 1 alpha subcomplex assembly factor 2